MGWLLLVLLACSPDREPLTSLATSESGSTRLTWSTEPDPLPLNEEFVLVLELVQGDESLVGAEVYLDADMPAHGHGMVRRPRVLEAEEGTYRVEGMLLHMPGHWLVEVDVIVGDLEERIVFPIDLE